MTGHRPPPGPPTHSLRAGHESGGGARDHIRTLADRRARSHCPPRQDRCQTHGGVWRRVAHAATAANDLLPLVSPRSQCRLTVDCDLVAYYSAQAANLYAGHGRSEVSGAPATRPVDLLDSFNERCGRRRGLNQSDYPKMVVWFQLREANLGQLGHGHSDKQRGRWSRSCRVSMRRGHSAAAVAPLGQIGHWLTVGRNQQRRTPMGVRRLGRCDDRNAG